MILIINNYDSFVYNLDHLTQMCGYSTQVVLNDAITTDEIKALNPSHIIISPGPCGPNEAGICLETVRTFYQTTPILGICLGHQVIGQAFGARITRATRPMHGLMSHAIHHQQGLFSGIGPLRVARYHSLIIENNTLPQHWHVDAYSPDHEIMAIRHPQKPLFGLQFHPESIIAEHGQQLMMNFLHASRDADAKIDSFSAKAAFDLDAAVNAPDQ